MREIGIALLGLGNVGLGTYRILENHAADIERRVGARVRVRHVLVRDPAKGAGPDGGVRSRFPGLTTDFERILADPQVAIVVELMGGVGDARRHLLRAIESGRHVVTANKALLASHGEELFSKALEKGVDLHFEAAVCGGIPIIRTIRESLAADRIEEIYGIVNGTTNLVLSEMALGTSYAAALKKAQELGFAEADPTLDVSGQDAAQKLCLLAQLAFMAKVQPGQIPAEGIEALAPVDVAYGRDAGYALKLLALARRLPDGAIDARVHPAFVPDASPLAEVRGGFNAVMLRSAALGSSLFSGLGAGALPTGSAVVADIIDICRNLLAGVSGRLPMLCAPYLREVPLLPLGLREGPYYLRFSVSDEPGVLGRIAGVLGERGVSIASVLQRPRKAREEHSTIVVFTHTAKESEISQAVRWIDSLKTTASPTRLVRIEEGPTLAL